MLGGVHVHVAHQVGAVLEAFLAHSALEGPLAAVRALVVLQVGRLAEGLVARLALEGLLARVHALVPGQLRQVLEALLADGALVGSVAGRGEGEDGGAAAGGGAIAAGRLAVGGRRRQAAGGARTVGLLTDGTLHGVAAVVGRVVLSQGGEQREAHLTNATHERLLLHLNTLVLQQVGGLVEDLGALGALEGAVLGHHALVLVWVCHVGDVMSTGSTLVSSVRPYL